MIEFKQLFSLVDPKDRDLLEDYMSFLRLGEQHFLFSKTDSDLSTQQLQLLEKALRREFPFKKNLIARLQKAFVKNNLSSALLIDVLQGWRYASERKIDGERRFFEICGCMLAPLARLLMVLNGENPCTYLPMSSLLVCLYWMHLMENKVSLLQGVKLSKRNKINKLNGLIKNSKVILQVISSKKLKFKLAILLNTLQVKVQKIAENKHPRIGTLDGLKIFLYSTFQFFCIKRRTVCQRGI